MHFPVTLSWVSTYVALLLLLCTGTHGLPTFCPTPFPVAEQDTMEAIAKYFPMFTPPQGMTYTCTTENGTESHVVSMCVVHRIWVLCDVERWFWWTKYPSLTALNCSFAGIGGIGFLHFIVSISSLTYIERIKAIRQKALSFHFLPTSLSSALGMFVKRYQLIT